jgi:prolyl oligopeptidase
VYILNEAAPRGRATLRNPIMRFRPFLRSLALLAAAAPVVAAQAPPSYPETRKSGTVDTFYGLSVADPYRWLENTTDPETQQWIAAENSLTFAYLAAIPRRAAIRERLGELWNFPRTGLPVRWSDILFYTYNSGLQNQPVVYAERAKNGEKRIILDPNTLSADGTVALSAWAPSRNARYFAYAVSVSGSDWQEIRVRDLESGKDLADTVRWAKFTGIAWTADSRGFFYSRYAAPADSVGLIAPSKGQKLYYHHLGDRQARDRLIWERPDEPEWYVGAQVSDDGEFLIISISEGTSPKNRLYYMDLEDAGNPHTHNPIVKSIDRFDARYRFIDNAGDYFFIQTDLNAPRGKVVRVDLNQSRKDAPLTVVPESEDKLQDAELIGVRLVIIYLHDAHSVVKIYGLRGGLDRELPLPGLGTVNGLSGRPDEPELFYSFVSFLQPATIFRADLRKPTAAVFAEPKLTFDASKYETKQVFYKSKDGTRVPMFITARKGLVLDGQNPTMLYAYGGFDIPSLPSFSASRIAWLELGGVYAVANIRGGGEYGEAWHQGGMLAKKQNVFDDFIAAAQYLESEKYTSPAKLAIVGGSNGGLLVGAVETQRPELFGVALPEVGVMDMLRYQKFTAGWGWKVEYGSADDSAQFAYLIAYSPLHNIRPGTHYPATLITTSDHDDRVVPGHSFKFAAAMQAAQAGPAPVLIRVETNAGHGAGKPISKVLDVAADELAFTVTNLGMSGMTP